ncbi:YhfC family intramembrane metalloprotease [Alkalibacter saccharofermentans]|uniref:Uncharacterized membrane protein YhfC n=1 Tax=Alkalibacter saccharofermentans DSM 14828 TaxID=1120975 RepID=A0A1M4ZMW9_9FIRM|nr:YhfC family glutamic-type intramembrane protease [Alkalibacter saccharofermentans]SHF19275.1 Uncharacterized membrane protein YhfC [Alkalibacter saccharofermentans DSM 14828]
MVDIKYFLAALISFLLSVVFPIILLVYIKSKHKSGWAYILAGAMFFFVFQMMLRIPLISYLQGQVWFYINVASNRTLMAVFLSFTAGIFEEIGRYIAFLLLKRKLSYENALGYGVGHGGFESIAIVGITSTANFVAISNLTFGWFDSLVSALPNIFLDMEALRALFLTVEPHLFIAGGLERVFALILHIGLSVMVAKSVYQRKPGLLIAAIMLHGGINLIAITMPNIYLAEGFLMIIALISVVYIRRQKNFADRY